MQKKLIENLIILAKEKKVKELKNLSNSVSFVEAITQIIHQVQFERGVSCLYLASDGKFFKERAAIIAENNTLEELFVKFNSNHILYNDVVSAKQLNLATWVMLGLDSLDSLRNKVSSLKISINDCFEAYTRLVRNLIELIFEITNDTHDSKISRILVCLYNLIQGKESAGQERAVGSYICGLGIVEEGGREKISGLIESQEKSFELFYQFAPNSLRVAWDALNDSEIQKIFLRYRNDLARVKIGNKLPVHCSDNWFEVCSKRLNAMGDIESDLAVEMKTLVEYLISEADLDLKKMQLQFKNKQIGKNAGFSGRTSFDRDFPLQGPYHFLGEGTRHSYLLEPIVSVLQEQSKVINEMDIELSEVKKTLSERKVIEQAKGLLMSQLSITEADAYQWMRSTAMKQNRKILDVADNVLKKVRK